MSKSSRRRSRQRRRKIDEKRDVPALPAQEVARRAMPAPDRRAGEPTRRRPRDARATSAARQDMTQLSQMEMQHYSEHYSGPVPPPAMLERYDYLVPGSAKKIIDTAMGQTVHRQAQESKVISGSEARADRGQILGALILLAGIGCGLVIALAASPVVGGTVIGGVVASGALVYVVGGRPPKEEQPPPPPGDSDEG